MTSAAVILGTWGVAMLFAPGEVSAALGWGGGEVAASLAAAGLLAVALLDWMGRGAIYGGIYGRPIVLANVTLGVIGGLALLDHRLAHSEAGFLGWLPVLVLGAQAGAFGLLLVGRLGGVPRA